MASLWVVVPSIVLYLVLLAPNLPYIASLIGSWSVAGITVLMGNPVAATLTWMQLLVGDFFIGRWIYLDSRERNLTAWIVSPSLFITYVFSPIGFLAYLVTRYWVQRQ